MFANFLKFFIDNSRMNYTLFILLFAAGIWSYNNIAKEVFPSFDMDMVSIKGGYSGTSVDVLDKMAVVDIENELKSLDGVTNLTTIIRNGSFSIIIEFQKGKNRYDILNKVKDMVALSKGNLPSDMTEPNVQLVTRNRDLLNIALTSNTFSTDDMKEYAQQLKTKLYNVKGVSDVEIFGDSDLFFELTINEEKLRALNINSNSFFNTLREISYIYPIGKIEDTSKQLFLSTNNGPKNEEELQNTLIRINDKMFYLNEVAQIKKKYEDSSTLYSFNGKSALSLSLKQLDTADAITITKEVKKLLDIENKKNPDIKINISNDNSKRILDRLNIVSSNITFGIILITLLVVFLINMRMSAVIVLGIPTSFVIGVIYMYLTGYSINMITLVGVLIAIGIVVDDAIVVSENIQQHIEEGMSPKESAFKGTMEVVKPVTIASITTLFAFLPILMISGTMGEIIKLIPIAVSALIVASLIESFIFLPIHASHILKNNSKVTSWEKANIVYNKIIHFFMNWRKTFIIIFIIFVPLATIGLVKMTKFQMFPKFDANEIRVSIKLDKNSSLENSYEVAKKLENELLPFRDELYIETIDTIVGYRIDAARNTERSPYVMYMTLELQNLKPQTFVDEYITKNLAFYKGSFDGKRDISSRQVAKKLNQFFKKNKLKEKYNLEELIVLQKRVGPVKSDIKVGLVSNNLELIEKSAVEIEESLKKIKGVINTQSSIKYGLDEVKITLNDYGQKLGLTENYIGSYLSNIYLVKTKTKVIDQIQLVDVKVQSVNKDNFKNLSETLIPVGNKYVKLEDVADLNIKKSFEQISKDFGLTTFFVYANVDPKVITAGEVSEQLKSLYKELEEKGLQLKFKGEAEQKAQLKNDMMMATGLALILIMLSMLYLFNSFRESFIVMSVIPFSFLGVLIGHQIMGMNLSMPSIIGALGLAGVVINDGIIMMTYLKKAQNLHEFFIRSAKRFRPIMITTITTLIGLSTLMFFPSGESVIFQPIAVSLGFGLLWGTILNLIYIPVLYSLTRKLK